jgi:hypothetical protein
MAVYFSHHKVATGWTTQLLSEVAYRIGLPVTLVHNHLDERYDQLGRLSKENPNHLFLLTNATPQLQVTLSFEQAVHVIRDPRDIIVSAYYSHKNSHAPWDASSKAHFDLLKTLPLAEGICREIEFSKARLLDMQNWNYADKRVAELRYEALAENPREFALATCEKLGLLAQQESFTQAMIQRCNRILFALNNRRLSPLTKLKTIPGISVQELRGLTDKRSFENLTGRAKGISEIHQHLRKGSVGDWKEHFTPNVKHFFKSVLPSIVSTLGYETSEDW